MLSNNEIVTLQSIFKIGTVLSVNGREVKIKVDKQKNLSHIIYKGELIKNVSVGGYVKIVNGFTVLIAKVDGEYMQHEISVEPENYKSPESSIYRVLSVSLLGYMTPSKFVKGIKQLPLIDNDCYLLSNEELKKLVEDLPYRPYMGKRLSLAGAQEKAAICIYESEYQIPF